MAKYSLVRVLLTPSHFVLNSSRDQVRPASSLFSGVQENSVEAKSGELGGGGGAAGCDFWLGTAELSGRCGLEPYSSGTFTPQAQDQAFSDRNFSARWLCNSRSQRHPWPGSWFWVHHDHLFHVAGNDFGLSGAWDTSITQLLRQLRFRSIHTCSQLVPTRL